MAESPGKLLSSICLGGESSSSSGQSTKYGGGSCVNIFIHLFDWNRRLTKKGLFFNRRLLVGTPQDSQSRKRRKSRRKSPSMVEDRLPMAKLLLIADENRRIQRAHDENSAEIRSLQELLHLDHEDPPKMLQDLLSSRRQDMDSATTTSQDSALLNLLIQEVKTRQSKQMNKAEIGLLTKQLSAASKATSRSNSSVKSSNTKCHTLASAGSVGVASAGCGAFGRRTSGLFLEAAAKILDPRNRPSRRSTRALGKVSSENKEVDRKHAVEEKVLACSSEGSTSIRSLMELFLDDLEQDMATTSGGTSFRDTVSEPGSPAPSEPRTVNLSPPQQSTVVSVDDLEEHDYISFRDFLTAGGGRLKDGKAGLTKKVDEVEIMSAQARECLEETAVAAEEFKFMVHNPLFDDCGRTYSESELDNEDDQGLEEILKSILCQTKTSTQQSPETSRLTWLPDSSSNLSSSRDSFLYNKDNGSEADENHQLDIDSVELTSESNCGDDCSQPSPVSVLDSPFDDELHRKAGKRCSSAVRKRLDFSDDPATLTTSTSSSSSSRFARVQRLDVNTLEEAEEYILMVLEESGISYHTDVTLLVPDNAGAIVSSSVFERLEDRVRVQQLIEHLEACGSTSSAQERDSHHSLESLRAHYESYHECRSRRRMVFDFVNEVLSSIIVRTEDCELPRGRRSIESGRELVREAQREVLGWKRLTFESIHELVDKEIARSSCRQWRNFHERACDIGFCCEQEILADMVEELARELMA